MNIKQHLLPLAIGVILGGSILSTIAFKNNEIDEKNTFTADSRIGYKWYAPKTPEKISFAGEAVPLNRWDVKERLDRELLINYYMHGSTIYILKLTARTMPTIERILKEQGIPDDFKYLAVAESALYNQVSKAGAVGYWQFLKATGTQYGLEITDDVDERYDLEKSTLAACKYLRAAYEKLGTWTAAAASYNCGMGGYNNFSSYQGSTNYYDILLPEETNRYIFRILALKYLLGNAERIGFMVGLDDMYKPIKKKQVAVTNSIDDLTSFANQNGTTYKKLKLTNEWLRGRKLTAKPGKTYNINIPLE